jgi:hypothetical protein
MKFILTMALSVLLGASMALAQGNDKGNGGDILSEQDPMYGVKELQEKVNQSLRVLDTIAMGQLGSFLAWFDGPTYPFFADAPSEIVGQGLRLRTLFQNLGENVKIEYVTTPLCAPQAGGRCRDADAINDPKTMTIKIHIARARLLSETNVLRLLLHEYLSIFGFEKSFDYQVSGYIFKHIAWWSHFANSIPDLTSSGYGVGTWRSNWSLFVNYSEIIGQNGQCKKTFHSGTMQIHNVKIDSFETISVPLNLYCVTEQVYIQAETPNMISDKVPFRGARGYKDPSGRVYEETPFKPSVIPDFDIPTNYTMFPEGIPHFYVVPLEDDWDGHFPRYAGPKKVTRRLFRKDKVEDYKGPITYHFFLGKNGPRLFTLENAMVDKHIAFIYPNEQRDCSVDRTGKKTLCPANMQNLEGQDLVWVKK